MQQTKRLLDDGPAKPLLDHLGLLSHRKDDREGEALLTTGETAELLAQCGRQHGDRALDEVDAGGTLTRVAIESSVRLHEVRDVCNMNADIIRPVFVDLDRQRVVDVLCAFRIYREDALAPEILANLELALGDTKRGMSGAVVEHARCMTYVQGIGGRHFNTLSVKSSVGKLQSLSNALVSTSTSPIGPSSSTSVPNGCKELMGCVAART